MHAARMCGSACTAERVLLTSSESSSRWKESAAVLLRPSRSARTVMSSSIALRAVINSVAIMATPVTSSTTVQVSRMISVSLRLIGMLASHRMLGVPLSRIGSDDAGALEQLGADLDSPGLGGSGIDLKANFAAVDVEIDDPAALGEFVHVTDAYRAGAAQAREDLAQLILF